MQSHIALSLFPKTILGLLSKAQKEAVSGDSELAQALESTTAEHGNMLEHELVEDREVAFVDIDNGNSENGKRKWLPSFPRWRIKNRANNQVHRCRLLCYLCR